MLKLRPLQNLLFLITLILTPLSSFGVVSSIKDTNVVSVQKNPNPSIKDFEKELGRKLKFKEKIIYRIFKKKIQKSTKKEKTLSDIAVIFSLAAVIPYIGIFSGLIGILLGLISFEFTHKAKDKEKHKKGALFAILAGILITALHLLLYFAAVIGRSQ